MAATTPGTIIVLNGCASGGKTSIAKAIQRTFDAPYLHVGIDLFWLEVFPADRASEIFQLIPLEAASPPRTVLAVQPFGKFCMSGLHHTIAALARMGHNVVVDHVLTEASYLTEILALWQSFPVWLVGVSCPLETVCQRAATRADRQWPFYLPLVTWMFDEAHAHTRGTYDLEVDTSRSTPTECALQIKQVLDARGAPSAFNRLAARIPGTSGEGPGSDSRSAR
jgi:chloramphenicol 3-O phosphotransferase